MRKTLLWCSVLFAAFAGAAFAEDATAPGHNTLYTGKDLKWGDPPPVLEKGAQFTVLAGDPSKEGLYVVRLKMPANYKINPHWHPTDEHVTVISGSLLIGMGESFDKAAMKELPAGGYVVLPGEMRHYAMAGKKETVLQVHGMGPFQLTYVNPADDPSTRATAK
ncbi:MAG TPA: cupin domain-containing protein [Candidatus Eisenbacteria bacterium]|nr:cupin domain-containing protein [Candidatus Eisenbacteria bacterium]